MDTPIIGTLNEQTLHLALKNWIDPDPSHHEVKYLGAVADVMNENGIFEIETRSFSRLKKKVSRFIEEQNVTVVFPIAEHTKVVIVDKDGKEIKSYRSPKKGDKRELLCQMFLLPPEVLDSERLKFVIIMLDVIQYRQVVSNGKRLVTKKADRRPTSINGSETVEGRKALLDFCVIPDGDFTAADFSKANKLNGRKTWTVLKLYENLGLLSCDKSGRAYIYRRI
ncbi:MAG: hypothetical protein KBT31_05895 [Firmicutes bacterium]|nr:hypothetical protein [Candidatus Colimorpha enterica]